MARDTQAKRRRAAVYARISLDRQGAGLGVQRQLEDCEELASDRDLEVVGTYSDNDVSAYSGKLRPGYRQLLDHITQGLVDVVITWHADRLHRSPRELEEWIEACERHGVVTLTVRAGELDLTTAAGRMVARMLGAAARHESEQKSERVRRARQQAAGLGQPNGKLGYGYRDDRSIDSVQADVVREVATRILANDTLYAIASDLNARGVPSPGGAQWRTGNMRVMVMRGALCGWREWEPGRGGHGRGNLVAKGNWAPILDREQTERLRALLCSPERRRGRVPMYLLSGVLVCGRCGARMSGSKDGTTRRYGCAHQPGLDRCGRCTVVAEPVEFLIEEAVFTGLTGTRLRRGGKAAHQPPAVAVDELEDARRRLSDLAGEYAAGGITRAEWATAREVAIRRVESAQESLSLPRREAVLAGIPTQRRQVEEWWTVASLDRRRAVVKALIERVVVQPAGKGGNRFDPSRIESPIWKG